MGRPQRQAHRPVPGQKARHRPHFLPRSRPGFHGNAVAAGRLSRQSRHHPCPEAPHRGDELRRGAPTRATIPARPALAARSTRSTSARSRSSTTVSSRARATSTAATTPRSRCSNRETVEPSNRRTVEPLNVGCRMSPVERSNDQTIKRPNDQTIKRPNDQTTKRPNDEC